MTSIRFIGDVPLWLGALVALTAAVAVWFFYRREKHDLPPGLRIWLPLLRAAAVFLTVLVLTGPVLHHRRIEGQLGRVVVFLDASLSMASHDPQMPDARKLILAEQQGGLPAGNVDATLWQSADRLASIPRATGESLQSGSLDVEQVNRHREILAQASSDVADSLDGYDWKSLASSSGSDAMWQTLASRFRKELQEPAQALLTKPIDQVGARQAVAAELLDLTELAARFENELLAAFDAYGSQLLASGNAAATAAVTHVDDTSRWQRAQNSLLHPDNGLLHRLAATHDVQLIALAGTEEENLWDRLASQHPPDNLNTTPTSPLTDLGSAIAGHMTAHRSGNGDQSQQQTQSRTAVVLLTDGRHNSGKSPVQVARVLGGQSIPIHAVGFGARREPPDLALLDVEHPDLVFQKDRVRGTLLLKDQMPAGQAFVAQIGHGEEILWQEQLTTQDVRLRRVEFDFSIDELVERLGGSFDPDVKHHALPLTLRAVLAPLNGETETSNNEMDFRFSAITQSYRILLIDGRPRWETRYLRNVFERDDQWQIDTILVGPATEQTILPRGDGPDRFPADRGALFQYDLIVLGDVAPEVFAENELQWIRDFVENRGGGLIFIDGSRSHLRFDEDHLLAPLLPVTRLDTPLSSLPSQLQLTALGEKRNALMLAQSQDANQNLWKKLPAPHAIVAVEALPDTETLVEAVVGERTLPAMVTRTFGAGRVFYSALDETWRWRYKAADTYHQRFWNQLARWVMPRPFAVSDEYVALDTGPPTYASGEIVDIRVQLRGVDGRPATDATVDAVLWQEGRVVSTVTLAPDESGSGVYRGRTGQLAEGRYEVSVRASGFSHDALRARTTFLVQPPESRELELIACNDGLLEEMARSSGGQFLREEQSEKLIELLAPLSSGRVIESDTLLWQSYWWFAAIILLLTLEWLLRKRAGLL